MNNSYRIIDANLNRACEGIRVIEDSYRFYYNEKIATEKFRSIRHSLREVFSETAQLFLLGRDSQKDVGKIISQSANDDNRSSINDTITANFKRVEEALRVVEESAKVLGLYVNAKKIEAIRFEIYSLEKESLVFARKKIDNGLYGITASNLSNGKTNIECVIEMAKAGIKTIQYREKYKSLKEKIVEAREIRKITAEYGVTFIVNDNIDLAMLVDSDGIHIGQDDFDIKDVRQLVGDKFIIGVSTHSPQQAEKAVSDGADYIGVGPLYATQTKENVCAPVGLNYLDYVVKNINIPFVAIGGIKLHNINDVVSHGAKTIALVSEIVGSDNIAEMIKRLNKIIKGEI